MAKEHYTSKDRAKLNELMDEGQTWDYISSYMRGWLKARTKPAARKIPKKVTSIKTARRIKRKKK